MSRLPDKAELSPHKVRLGFNQLPSEVLGSCKVMADPATFHKWNQVPLGLWRQGAGHERQARASFSTCQEDRGSQELRLTLLLWPLGCSFPSHIMGREEGARSPHRSLPAQVAPSTPSGTSVSGALSTETNLSQPDSGFYPSSVPYWLESSPRLP
jgi:hypothetical protein